MAIFKKSSRFFIRVPNSPLRPTATGSSISPGHPTFSPIRRPQARRKLAHSFKSSHSLIRVLSIRRWLNNSHPYPSHSEDTPTGSQSTPRINEYMSTNHTTEATENTPMTSSKPSNLGQRTPLTQRNRTLSGRVHKLQKRFQEQSRNFTSIDNLPFAIRSQTMVPLSVAARRNDIRLRQEGFEMCKSKPQLQKASFHSRTFPIEEIASISPARISVTISEPSIYSEGSFDPQLTRSDESYYDEVTTSVSMSVLFEGSGYIDHSLSILDEASDSVGELGDSGDLDFLVEDTFNESSFLRIATTELDW